MRANQSAKGVSLCVPPHLDSTHQGNRCVQTGHECLGYQPPKPWIFEGSKTNGPVGAVISYNASVSEHPEIATQPYSPSAQLTRQLPSLFSDQHEEQRSLDFFLSATGPTLANYGPSYEFWNELIPQMAWHNAACRHLLVAMAQFDEQIGLYRIATRSALSPVPVWHYHAAIKEMAISKEDDAPAMTLASLMAWVFEALQGNYPTSRVHIGASLRLWTELQSRSSWLTPSARDLLTQIEPMIRWAGSYTQAIFDDEVLSLAQIPPNVIRAAEGDNALSLPFHSLGEAREMLMRRIQNIDSSPNRWTQDVALSQRLYFKRWHKSIRRYCSTGPESNLHKQAVQILFNVAMALLPECEAGAFSHAANPAAVGSVLDSYQRVMCERKRERRVDDADIERTLSSALETIRLNITDEPYQHRAEKMLVQLKEPG